MKKQNILLIINPVAGRKEGKRMIYRIVDSLCRQENKTTIFTTGSKGEATEIVAKYAKESDKIICTGGDGTVNEILTGLNRIGHSIPIGYIPAGTTNDLARALKLPRKASKAIDNAISSGKIIYHDVGAFNKDRVFSYIASFGAFIKVAYATPQWLKNLMGYAAYIYRGILSIPEIKPHKLKVIADGREIEGEFIFGSVSNSTVIAALVKLPKKEIDFADGEFEVTLIKAPRKQKELNQIIKGILRQSYDNEHVYFFKTKNIKFIFDKETEWTIDGEFGGSHKEVEINNLMHRAQLLVPQDS